MSTQTKVPHGPPRPTDTASDSRKYASFFEHAVLGAFRATPDGRLLDANPALAALLGYASTEEMLNSIRDIGKQIVVDPREFELFTETLDRAGSVVGHEINALSKDGGFIWVSVSAWAGRGEDGRFDLIEGLAEDVTERKRRQWLLMEAEEKYRTVFENSPEGLFQSTPHGLLLGGNKALASMFGYGSFEDMANTVTDLGDQLFEDPERYAEFVRQMDKKGMIENFEAQVCKKNWELFWVSVTARTVRDIDGRPILYQGSIQDITSRKTTERKLMEQRFQDSLTGLANRAMFVNQTAKALARARRHKTYSFALLCVDIDRFRETDQQLGREAADKLLEELGRRFVSCLRCEDVCARLSGDDFAALLSDVKSPQDVLRVIDRLRETLCAPYVTREGQVSLALSMGAVLSRPGHANAEEMLRDAGLALARAKSTPARPYAIQEEGAPA